MMGGIVQLALLLGGASAARRRLDDASCYDDASWYIGGSPHKDCGYLSKKEHLCAKKDQATKTVGYEACPYACGLCDAGTDSTSWYATGKPKNDCDWIVGFRRPSVRARHDAPPPRRARTRTRAAARRTRTPRSTPGTPARRPAAAPATTATRPTRASPTFTTRSRTASAAATTIRTTRSGPTGSATAAI